MTYQLYRGDLIDEDSLRLCGDESSDQTVTVWSQPEDPYEFEQIGPEVNTKARLQYFAMTGERVLFRLKVLGLPVDDRFLKDSEVLSAHPFTDADCTVAELIVPSVQIAMAYVPLTPDVNDETSQPVLARLYCVRGLNGKHPIPFDSAVPVGAEEGYSWFLAGCKKNPKPKHESWHLAAHLLMRVVEDVHRKKNLATHFVVTGRVQSAEIKPVEMGRKPELADVWEFKDLRWIMHEDNKMNMNNAMRKVETPKTLDEALELIEKMQNRATRSFFRFLHDGDLDGMTDEYKNQADIFACEESTGLMPMEILGGLIKEEEKRFADKRTGENSRLVQLNKAMTWLRSHGADCALMFYMLAKYGLDDALRSCLKIWPIEARTANGFNATELALESGDYDTARKLCSLGCKCRPELPNSFLSNAVNLYFDADMKARQTVATALSVGLNPCCKYVLDNGSDCNGYPVYGYKTSLFGAALYHGDYNLIEKCLDAGADPNSMIEICRWYEDDEDAYQSGIVHWEGAGYYCQAEDRGSPLYIVNCLWAMSDFDSDEEIQDKISALLMSRGAKKDVRVARVQYIHEVDRYLLNGISECKKQVLKFIDEGQSFGVRAIVRYSSADDVPKTEELRTTLWGAAVYYGDVELMRKCLEHGASTSQKLQFAHAGKDKVVDLQYLNGRTPYEVIMMSEDIPLENQMLAIQVLKEYGLKNQDCPKDLVAIMHEEELSSLKNSDDPYASCRIDLDDSGHMIADTTVWGKAVYMGWADVVERCLQMGVSARNELEYWDWMENEFCSKRHLLDNGTPNDLILKNKDIAPWKKNRIAKLLRKYANE